MDDVELLRLARAAAEKSWWPLGTWQYVLEDRQDHAAFITAVSPDALVALVERVQAAEAALEDLVNQRDHARSLAGRLWCDDRPDDSTIASICVYLKALPPAEFEQLDAEFDGEWSDLLASHGGGCVDD